MVAQHFSYTIPSPTGIRPPSAARSSDHLLSEGFLRRAPEGAPARNSRSGSGRIPSMRICDICGQVTTHLEMLSKNSAKQKCATPAAAACSTSSMTARRRSRCTDLQAEAGSRREMEAGALAQAERRQPAWMTRGQIPQSPSPSRPSLPPTARIGPATPHIPLSVRHQKPHFHRFQFPSFQFSLCRFQNPRLIFRAMFASWPPGIGPSENNRPPA